MITWPCSVSTVSTEGQSRSRKCVTDVNLVRLHQSAGGFKTKKGCFLCCQPVKSVLLIAVPASPASPASPAWSVLSFNASVVQTESVAAFCSSFLCDDVRQCECGCGPISCVVVWWSCCLTLCCRASRWLQISETLHRRRQFDVLLCWAEGFFFFRATFCCFWRVSKEIIITLFFLFVSTAKSASITSFHWAESITCCRASTPRR